MVLKNCQKSILATALLLAMPLVYAQNYSVRDVRVEGLQRLNAGTVFSQLGGDTATLKKGNIQDTIGRLYATELFDDVRVYQQNEQHQLSSLYVTGDVGIGIATPTSKLHIYQTAGGANQLTLDTNFSNGNAFALNPFITNFSNFKFKATSFINCRPNYIVAYFFLNWQRFTGQH